MYTKWQNTFPCLLAEGLLYQEVPKKMHQNSWPKCKIWKKQKNKERKKKNNMKSGVWNACFCCQRGLQHFPVSCSDAMWFSLWLSSDQIAKRTTSHSTPPTTWRQKKRKRKKKKNRQYLNTGMNASPLARCSRKMAHAFIPCLIKLGFP